MSRTPYELTRYLPTKVVDSQTQGRIRIVWLNPSQYKYCIVAAGSTPPSTADEKVWTRLDFQTIEFAYRHYVDIYFLSESEDGKVIFDDDAPYTDVYQQDQTTPAVFLYMNRELSTFTLSGVQTVGSFVLNVVAGHTVVAGNYVCLQETDTTNKLLRFFQAKVITAGATTLEVSRPIDYPFDPAKVNCSRATRVNMAGEVGTTASPIKYFIKPTFGKWHIYQIHIKMFSPSGTFDDGTFGPLSELVHGITIMKRNGYVYNMLNIKNNGEILGFGEGSIGYSPKPPAGTGSGLTATISLISGNGTVPELDASAGGSLEAWIPDSLAAWPSGGSLEIKVEGHIVL